MRALLDEREAEIARLNRNVEELSKKVREAQDATSGNGQFSYTEMVTGLGQDVRRFTPSDARLAITSKGDDALLEHADRTAEHFPSDLSGRYLGFHPSSGQAAVALLEAARWRGAEFFVLPRSASWWLEEYPSLARHIDLHYRLVNRDDQNGAIWSLDTPSAWRGVGELLTAGAADLARQPVILDWHTGRDITARFPECRVCSPVEHGAELPYVDDAIDVVAVSTTDAAVLSEARRVASWGIVLVGGADEDTPLELLWTSDRMRTEQAIDASIVVASKRDHPVTGDYLMRLSQTLPGSFRGEIIVAEPVSDTARTDTGAAAVTARVNVVRESCTGSFADRLRRGAEIASGELLVCLESGTWPVPGWLPPLLGVFRDVPGVGVASGMLLEPDGRMLHAGGQLGPDGQLVTIGEGDYRIARPRYNYLRQVDSCPVDLFATPTALFLECDGLAERDGRAPELEYCSRVRGSGRNVVYQPEVVAIRGATSEVTPPGMQSKERSDRVG